MPVKPLKIKQKIETVTIGATKEQDGARSHIVTIGGQECMPFLCKPGQAPNKPVTAIEFWDVPPDRWNPYLADAFSKVWHDPVKWAEKINQTGGGKLLFLRLMGAHPDYGAKTPEDIEKTVKHILENVTAPIIIVGSGVMDVDREIMPAAAKAAEGENLLIGNATTDCYREITAACIRHGHSLITESPIDINIAKQANILAQDAGLPPDRIVMYATTGALGYGIEYAYSIMEQSRLAGLEGDRFMNKPQAAFVGQETWKTKEAAKSFEAALEWEVTTSLAYLHAGADIIIARHPDTCKRLEGYVLQE